MHFIYACKIVITKLSVTELLGTIFSAHDYGKYCALQHKSVVKIEGKKVRESFDVYPTLLCLTGAGISTRLWSLNQVIGR